eukprot:COSAG01_NODE_5594_length_4158_cov_32.377679_3_plen_182_part_00
MGGGHQPAPAPAEDDATASSPPAAPRLAPPSVGERVRVHGLKGAPQYNGYTGRVTEARQDGRLVIALYQGGEQQLKALKPANVCAVGDGAAALAELSGRVTDVVDSLKRGVDDRRKSAGQALGSAAKLASMADDTIVHSLGRAAVEERIAKVDFVSPPPASQPQPAAATRTHARTHARTLV